MKTGAKIRFIPPALAAAGLGFLAGRASAPPPTRELPHRIGAPLIGIASKTGGEYVRSIRDAGGVPVILPDTGGDTGRVPDYLALLDGLVLPGGADIPPGEYGEDAHASVEPLDRDRFLFEKELAKAWIGKTDKPLLGICLGSQWINVASGGSLVQDIPTERNANHRNTRHPVEITPGSRLSLILGQSRIEVNSFHHQSSDAIGKNLRAVAKAPDGVIEAVETTDPRRFLIGVQWHPERMAPDDAAQTKLLKAFVEAAARQH